MTEDGYQTSSPTVWKLIESDGLDAFDVLEIVLEEELQIPFNNYRKVDEYEAWFLREHSCGISMDWLNKSNYELKSHDSEECKINMLKTYGVTNCSHIPEVRELAENTMLNKFGVRHAMQNATILESAKATHKSRTGLNTHYKIQFLWINLWIQI